MLARFNRWRVLWPMQTCNSPLQRGGCFFIIKIAGVTLLITDRDFRFRTVYSLATSLLLRKWNGMYFAYPFVHNRWLNDVCESAFPQSGFAFLDFPLCIPWNYEANIKQVLMWSKSAIRKQSCDTHAMAANWLAGTSESPEQTQMLPFASVFPWQANLGFLIHMDNAVIMLFI